MIEAVLFDVDGVLLDSREANGVFFQNLLEHFGYPRPTGEEVDKVFTMTMLDAIRFLTKEKSEEKVRKIWDAGHTFKYPENLVKIPDGSEDVIRNLSKNYLLGIVTSRIKKGVGDHKIKLKYFDVIVTFEDYSKPKPYPECLLVALKKLNLTPDEAVYVGDAEVDVLAAHTAGMKIISYPKPVEASDATAKTFKEIQSAIEMLE